MKRRIYILIIISILYLSILPLTGCNNANKNIEIDNEETNLEEEMRIKNGSVTYLEKTDVTSEYSESLNKVSEPVETIKLKNSDSTYEEIVHSLINKPYTSEKIENIAQIDNNVYLYHYYYYMYAGVVQDSGYALIEYNVETLEAKLLLQYNYNDDIFDCLLFDKKHVLICTRNDYYIYNFEKHEFKEKINLGIGLYRHKVDNGIYINGSFYSINNDLLHKFYSFEYINEKLTIYEFEVPDYNQFMHFSYYEGYFYNVNLYYEGFQRKYSNIVAVNIANNDNIDISSRYEEFVSEFEKNN